MLTWLIVVSRSLLAGVSVIGGLWTCVAVTGLVTAVAGCAGRSRAVRENTGCVSGASAPSAVVDGSGGIVDSGTLRIDASYGDAALPNGRFQNPSGMAHDALVVQRFAAMRAFSQCLDFDEGPREPQDQLLEWPTWTRSGTPTPRPREQVRGWVPLRTPTGAHCVSWHMGFNTGTPWAQFVVDALQCNGHDYEFILQGTIRAVNRGVNFEVDEVLVVFDDGDQFVKLRTFTGLLRLRWQRDRYFVSGTMALRLTPWASFSTRDFAITREACVASIPRLQAIVAEEILGDRPRPTSL